MRWMIALPMRLRSPGFMQLKSDWRMFAKYDCRGLLSAYLVGHFDDISFVGTDAELVTMENAMRTFSA